MLGPEFPHATAGNIKPTSPATNAYNCIAWAVHVDDRWIWPDEDGQYAWPPAVPREETAEAFGAFFQMAGYEPCQNEGAEHGFEKIALYARDGLVQHAARLMPNGRWVSKLGQGIDIEHASSAAISGGEYGWAVAFFRRRAGGRPELPPLHPAPPPRPLIIGL